MRMTKQSIIKWVIISACAALLFVFAPSSAIRAKATTISELQILIEKHKKELQDANDKIMNLKDAQSLLQEMIDDLNAEILNTMTSISMTEDEIAEKTAVIGEKEVQIADKKKAIEVTSKEYEAAKEQEEKQQDDMLVRIRRIYETGTSSFLNMLLRGTGFGNILNRLDFVEQIYSYDKNKLTEYQQTKQLVRDLWDQLEAEKQELESQKLQLETDKAQLEDVERELDEQKAELNRVLTAKKKENVNYDAEIKKAQQAANVAKTLIKQEQEKLKKLQEGDDGPKIEDIPDTDYTKIIDNAKGSEKGKKIAKYACQFIGNPYVYGGTSLTKGTDCSGFTWRIYSDFGYSITRTSFTQQKDGVSVNYSDAEPGDIVCYSGHVGMYIGGGKIVHASNQKDGIKVSNATYRTILTVRRIVK